MTTEDLSPMLPQPSDDNAPMISGRGTKIIADARGAYLAGNLRALIGHLNHEQEKRFKVAAIECAIWFAEKILQEMPDRQADSRFIQMAHNWLLDQTPINARAMRDALVSSGLVDYESSDMPAIRDAIARTIGLTITIEPLQGTTRDVGSYRFNEPGDWTWMLLNLALCLYAETAWEVRDLVFSVAQGAGTLIRQEAVSIPDDWIHLNIRALPAVSDNWLLEVAWAILQARTLPSLYMMIAADAMRGAYLSGDISGLLVWMNSDQETRFKQIIVPPAILCAEKKLLDLDEDNETARKCMEVVLQWLLNPSEEHRLAAEIILKQNPCEEDPLHPQAKWDAFQIAWLAASAVVGDATNAAEIALRLIWRTPSRLLPPNLILWFEGNYVKTWQCQVAWAILNNQETLSFELSE